MAQDDWTEEKCLQLIRAFKERPLLWDQRSPLYYKKSRKPDAWEEIAKLLNFTSEECRHKMVILMSSFRREKAKTLNGIKYGRDPNIPYRSPWFGYKEMSFLLDRDKDRRSESKESQDEDSDESKTSKVTEKPVRTIKLVRKSKQDDYLTLKPRKRPAPAATELDQQNPTTPQNNEDEIKHFSHFIASKMMRYSQATKNVVQREICEIIFKADQTCAEQNEFCTDVPLNDPGNTRQASTSQLVPIKEYYSDGE